MSVGKISITEGSDSSGLALLRSISRKESRGQALSYDALGGVVIFLIAVGILVVYWTSFNTAFSHEDADMVLEANTVLDNMMRPGVLMSQNIYEINATFLQSGCPVNKDEVGLVHEFNLTIVNSTGNVKANCSSQQSSNPQQQPSNPQQQQSSPKKNVVSERLAYYDGEPVKVVINVYAK